MLLFQESVLKGVIYVSHNKNTDKHEKTRNTYMSIVCILLKHLFSVLLKPENKIDHYFVIAYKRNSIYLSRKKCDILEIH